MANCYTIRDGFPLRPGETLQQTYIVSCIGRPSTTREVPLRADILAGVFESINLLGDRNPDLYNVDQRSVWCTSIIRRNTAVAARARAPMGFPITSILHAFSGPYAKSKWVVNTAIITSEQKKPLL